MGEVLGSESKDTRTRRLLFSVDIFRDLNRLLSINIVFFYQLHQIRLAVSSMSLLFSIKATIAMTIKY